jgi:hypothetical protein
MERMLRQFSAGMAQEKGPRDEAEKDIRFRAGDQWDARHIQIRDANDRPHEVFNKIPQFIASVVNECRKKKATIKFSPLAGQGDAETAKVAEELARAIQYNSDADIAYETAMDTAAGSSFGYFRLISRYRDFETDDQELAFVPVLDPMSICGVMIPSVFKRVVPFAFVSERLSKEEFERDYPDSKLANNWALGSLPGTTDLTDWVSTDQVRVAEYWWVEWERRKTASGRVAQVPHVKSCKTNGVEVFEDTETTWPGSIIPIWCVTGGQLVKDGKLELSSVTRWVRAPQKTINYAKNRVLETLGTQPVSPFIGPVGFKRGLENQWSHLNQKVTDSLEYNVIDASGKPIPKPERQVYEPPIAALSNFIAQEEEDLKSGTGIYDARLGARSNETSGIAIDRRNAQAETANFHFEDNLRREQTSAGKELGLVMGVVYDTDRLETVIGEDDSERVVRINAPYVDEKTGKEANYALAGVKFHARVLTGPGFPTMRRETSDMLAGTIQAVPELMWVIGDQYFRNLDAAGSQEMADRMKRAINQRTPGLIEDAKGGQQEIPPEVQQALQKGQQDAQSLNEYAKQKEAEVQQLQAKIDAKGPEIESRERIENAKLEIERERLKIEQQKIQAQIGIEGFKAGIKANIELRWAELESVKARTVQEQAELDRQHDSELASQGAQDQMALEFQQQEAPEEPQYAEPQAEQEFR